MKIDRRISNVFYRHYSKDCSKTPEQDMVDFQNEIVKICQQELN